MSFFYDIPKDNQGGSTLILNGTVPTPEEYNTFYQTVMDKKKKNKDKSASDVIISLNIITFALSHLPTNQ